MAKKNTTERKEGTQVRKAMAVGRAATKELDQKRKASLRRREQAIKAARVTAKARAVQVAPQRVRAMGAKGIATLVAEGDSWFDCPAHAKGGMIPRLSERLGIPILSLAKAGDEVRYMLGVEERKELRKHLISGGPTGTPWDVLLFSGGGHDIVDNPMALWVWDYEPGKSPQQLIHQPRFDAALALVRAGYEDLTALRDAHSLTTRLVYHTYDL